MTRKLDKETRSRLEEAFHRRKDKETTERHETIHARFHAVTLSLIRAHYGPMQRDMPTLERYGLCSDIGGINVRVYDPNPADHAHYRERFGFEISPGMKAPGAFNKYVDFMIEKDDPDWPLAWSIVVEIHEGRDRDAKEKADFAAAIRETSSWSVLEKRFPWIRDEFPDPARITA